MTAVKEKRVKIELTDSELKEARIHCGDFVGRSNRNRAVSNILGIKIAKKFFEENGIKADDKFSAYKIKKILEDFDIADIRIDGKIVDVRVVFNENMLFIPKSHYDYGITPAFYMFVKINKDLDTGEVLGFLDPLTVDDSKSSLEYYFPEKENLISVKMFKQKFKKIPYNDYPLKNTKEARRDIIRYYDNVLDNKTRFIRLIVNNEDVRKAVLEFENAEDLFSNISEDVKNYEETPVSETIPADYHEDDFYEDQDFHEVYEPVEDATHNEIKDEINYESVLTDEIKDYENPEPVAVNENNFYQEDTNETEFEIAEPVVEDSVAEEPDSDIIDYLDPENTDIEIEKEMPVMESVIDTGDTDTGISLVSEEIPETNDEFQFAEENIILSENTSDNVAEEPANESKPVDDFLIVDFDSDIDVNNKVIDSIVSVEEEEPHKMNAEAISNVITDDILSTEIHVSEDELPKVSEDVVTVEDNTNTDTTEEIKENKKVETDLDKLFKNGRSDESDEFEEDETGEVEYIAEETDEQGSEQEEKPEAGSSEYKNEIDDIVKESGIKIPELEELDGLVDESLQAKPKGKSKVKRIIVLTVGTAFLVSALTAGVTALVFNNVNVQRFDENPANKLQVKEIPLEQEPEKQNEMPVEGLKNLDLPKDTGKEFYVLPPSTTELEPNGFDIKNIDVSWDIPEICIDTTDKKNKLLNVGRKIKLALSNDILLTDEKPTQKNVIINLIVRDNTLKAGSIQATSGSKAIDKIVIQAVNDVLKSSKVTLEGLNNETGYPSLIISF